MTDMYGYPTQTKTGWSTGTKVAVGCGVTTFIVLILVCGGGLWVAKIFSDSVKAFIEDHEAAGFTIVKADQLRVTDTITGPTAFVSQNAVIEGDAADDLAFLCQNVAISSHVRGDIEEFRGQMLTLQSGARIDGNVNVTMVQILKIQNGAIVNGNVHVATGQIVVIEAGAVVAGQITGNWQALQQSPDALVGAGAMDDSETDEPLTDDGQNEDGG